MPAHESSPSRLFHAVIVAGCAIAGLEGCWDGASTPSPTPLQCTPLHLADGGVELPDGCVPDADAGWPPTK